MAKIGFVSTLIPADKFKKKYELGDITIFHIGEVLDHESGAYKCFECSMATAEFNEDEVMAAFEEFKAKFAASELATAKAQKIAEIDAYDTSPAVNSFYINGIRTWAEKDERMGFQQNIADKVALGFKEITWWFDGMPITLPCEKAEQLRLQLENYAFDCFNVTAAHKKAVSELNSIEEVEKYDITAGYPVQLKMEV